MYYMHLNSSILAVRDLQTEYFIYFVNQKFGQEEKLNLLKGCLLFRVMIAQYLYTINKHYVFVNR